MTITYNDNMWTSQKISLDSNTQYNLSLSKQPHANIDTLTITAKDRMQPSQKILLDSMKQYDFSISKSQLPDEVEFISFVNDSGDMCENIPTQKQDGNCTKFKIKYTGCSQDTTDATLIRAPPDPKFPTGFYTLAIDEHHDLGEHITYMKYEALLDLAKQKQLSPTSPFRIQLN